MTEARDVIATFYRSECGFTECKAYNETDAILTALRDAGFAVVPVEPTERMVENDELDRVVLDHARAVHSSSIDFARIYKAMLKAAQGGAE